MVYYLLKENERMKKYINKRKKRQIIFKKDDGIIVVKWYWNKQKVYVYSDERKEKLLESLKNLNFRTGY